MKATVTAPKSWKKVIEIVVENDAVELEFNKKLNKYKKDINIPGFRKGKVPTKMVVDRFGDSIRGEVLEKLMNDAYREACIENKITPISEPKIEDIKDEKGSDLTFKATVEIDPEIEITDYKGFNIPVEVAETTDEDVNKSVDNVLDQYATFNPIENPAEEGHVVTVDYVDIKIDGEDAPVGFMPAPQMVEIGKAPISELDDALKGVTIDAEKTVECTFPEDFRIEDVAGKSSTFNVIVKAVQEKVRPEITEDFLKSINIESEEALRDQIREDLVTNAVQTAKSKAHDEVIDKILEKNEFEIPESRVEHYIAHIMKEEEKYYPNGDQPSVAEYTERYSDVATKSLKRFRILDFVAKTEKIKATQEEVDAKIQEIADQYQQPFETVKQAFRQNGTTVQIREDIKEGKALSSLIGETEWPSSVEEA